MEVLLSPAAQADLADIWDYTLETWGCEQAVRYIRGIENTCAALGSGAHPSQSAEHIRTGYRKTIFSRHMLYFRIAGDRIEIIRILHQSMDVGEQLG